MRQQALYLAAFLLSVISKANLVSAIIAYTYTSSSAHEDQWDRWPLFGGLHSHPQQAITAFQHRSAPEHPKTVLEQSKQQQMARSGILAHLLQCHKH